MEKPCHKSLGISPTVNAICIAGYAGKCVLGPFKLTVILVGQFLRRHVSRCHDPELLNEFVLSHGAALHFELPPAD